MNRIYQVKTVGLCFNNPSHKVEVGEYVILKADGHNEFDEDAIGVYNSDAELIGHVANSERTLSPNNRKNGNISATELKGNLDFTNREYYGEAIKVFSSCIYLEVNEGKWSYINKSADEVPELTFKRAIDLLEPEVVEEPVSEMDALKSEIMELKSMVEELLAEVKALKSNEGDNSPSTSDRMLLSVVGLSHFQGQDNLGDILTIAEEPIFEGAKGTALYLKSGDYRVGVFPSERKREYCEEHGIPYYENKLLKNKDFGSDIRIEELVYDEYAIISV